MKAYEFPANVTSEGKIKLPDERSAVDRFFNLFEEFINQNKNIDNDEKQVKSLNL